MPTPQKWPQAILAETLEAATLRATTQSSMNCLKAALIALLKLWKIMEFEVGRRFWTVVPSAIQFASSVSPLDTNPEPLRQGRDSTRQAPGVIARIVIASFGGSGRSVGYNDSG